LRETDRGPGKEAIERRAGKKLTPRPVGLDDWPEKLRPLVEKHGADKVYRVGLETLGFPPNWSFPSREQILLLENAMR